MAKVPSGAFRKKIQCHVHVLAIHLGYLLFGSTTVVAGLLTTAFALAVTIPAAELLYRAVEAPGMKLARRLS